MGYIDTDSGPGFKYRFSIGFKKIELETLKDIAEQSTFFYEDFEVDMTMKSWQKNIYNRLYWSHSKLLYEDMI